MRTRFVLSICVAALSVAACSAAPPDEPTTGAEEPIAACPLNDSSCLPPLPTLDVIGAWDRHAGALAETLTLRADHSYSLVETTSPVCVRAPCPEYPTTIIQTAGTFAVSGLVVALSPVTHDARLPETFDIVRATPVPPLPTATTDGASIVAPIAPIVSLHAVERGSDIHLTRVTTPDCPTGTTKCFQCGAYPPGGVCQTFVCLPPTRRCIPVP